MFTHSRLVTLNAVVESRPRGAVGPSQSRPHRGPERDRRMATVTEDPIRGLFWKAVRDGRLLGEGGLEGTVGGKRSQCAESGGMKNNF